jgi:hypothetical protein
MAPLQFCKLDADRARAQGDSSAQCVMVAPTSRRFLRQETEIQRTRQTTLMNLGLGETLRFSVLWTVPEAQA